MFSKYVKKIIILLPVLLLFISFPVSAASYGSVEDWDGLVSFAIDSGRAYLTNSSYNFINTGSSTEVKTAIAEYSGTFSNIMTIEDLIPGSVIDGRLVVYGEVAKRSNSTNANGVSYYFYDPSVSFSADSENGITFGGFIRSEDSDSINFTIQVQFNEFYCTSDFIDIPFNMFINMATWVNMTSYHAIESIHVYEDVSFSFASDWAGDMYMYTDLRDASTIDGFIADQNQQIINNSSTQITVTQQQMEQQHADSQAQIQATQAQTDTLVNGYDSTAGQGVVNNFNDVAGSLEDAENDLFASADLGGINYDPFSEYITSDSAQAGFSFIRSVLQAIWNALGDFQIPIYLGLLLMIVTKFLGFQQFASGGGD